MDELLYGYTTTWTHYYTDTILHGRNTIKTHGPKTDYYTETLLKG
jgi:hypothetical protein